MRPIEKRGVKLLSGTRVGGVVQQVVQSDGHVRAMLGEWGTLQGQATDISG